MDFKLPDIGEGVHEGEITKWLVKEGDTVEADQPMVEVMTDKATVEIPAPVGGTVSSLSAAEGETVEVGKVILSISEGGSNGKSSKGSSKEEGAEDQPDQKKSAKAESKSQSEEESKPRAEAASDKSGDTESEVLPFNILATPATRKMARDLSVDLKEVKGTGTNGRITKEDVKLAYEGQQAAAPRSSHSGVTGSSSTAVTKAPPLTVTGDAERIPLRGMRKRIAEGMTRSKQTAAHFTYVEEVDMTEVVKLRKAAKPEAEERGSRITFLPFIIKAVIPALKEFPYLNSSLDDENQEIVVKHHYNIGIATDTEQGLMVPVVHDADRKSVWELADEISHLSELARTGKIKGENLKGGTFTLTNAGTIGGVFATPVINHPEVAILGVNAIRKRPVVVDDEIAIRDMMYLSISVDHRVVDGADAARFMNRVIYFLSKPDRLVFA